MHLVKDKNPWKHNQFSNEEAREMLDARVIVSVTSAWAIQVYLAAETMKNKDLFAYYRLLSRKSKAYCWPFPEIENFFGVLSGCTPFTTLNLFSENCQLMSNFWKEFMTFVSQEDGYQFILTLFGLTYHFSTFQLGLLAVLGDMHFAQTYLDDVVGHSITENWDMNNVKSMFSPINSHYLILKVARSKFLKDVFELLVQVVSTNGLFVVLNNSIVILDRQKRREKTSLGIVMRLQRYYREWRTGLLGYNHYSVPSHRGWINVFQTVIFRKRLGSWTPSS